MANIWDEFDKAIDTEGLAKDVEEAAENGGRREVPHDTYEVAVTKLELVKSKKGDPMVTCWMKIVEGEYKNSLIFMNQVVTQGFQLHIANEFMRAFPFLVHTLNWYQPRLSLILPKRSFCLKH